MKESQDSFWNSVYTDKQHKKYIWFDIDEIIPIRMLFEDFLKKSIYIDGFVSDSDECVDVYLLNKMVYSIKEIDMGNSFVFSTKKVEEYSQIHNVVENGTEECQMADGKVFVNEKECFGIQNVGWMREIVKGKNLFIYGLSDRTRKLAEIYELLDFHVQGYISDEPYEDEEGRKIISLEDIIYEEFFLF